MRPLVEGEVKGYSRWGRAFIGELRLESKGILYIRLGVNIIKVPREDLLWIAYRWTGSTDGKNSPAPHPDGFKYPAGFPGGCGPINDATSITRKYKRVKSSLKSSGAAK